MNLSAKFIILFIGWSCFSYCNEVKAQTSYPDAGSWNTLNIEYKINKRITGLFTEELRFKENFTRLNLFYTNLGIEYKISDFFKAALVYRFIEKYQDDNSFSFRHRIMLDLTFKKKIGRIGFSYRQRLQAEERDIIQVMMVLFRNGILAINSHLNMIQIKDIHPILLSN